MTRRPGRSRLHFSVICGNLAQGRAGEMLAETIERGGNSKSHDATLNDVGVNKTQSSRWQTIARIPSDVRDEHIRKIVDADKELTTASVLGLAADRRPSA